VKIKLNGEEKEIADGVTLIMLLEQLKIRPARVVVERIGTSSRATPMAPPC